MNGRVIRVPGTLGSVLLSVFNVTAGAFRLMPAAVGVQIAVGLVVPLLAALVPVIGGARISPHQAISNYGLGAGFGRNWLDWLVGRIRRLPRPLALSLRNTFRRKARVVLTMLTLVLGGVMFVVVMNVGSHPVECCWTTVSYLCCSARAG